MFCAIVHGEAQADIVFRDQRVCAFLDARPLYKGHVLVVPTAHYETIVDLPEAEIPSLFGAVARLAGAVERGLGADGVFTANNNRISQSVPHMHVHVIPRHKGDGLRGFFWPRAKYASADESADFARRIAAALPTG